VLILLLKQAESAAADGRLDEAYDIIISGRLREHSRGQKLIGKLARAFAKRGLDNLNNERVQLALSDCNKAEKLAGNIEEVAGLRSQICSEMEQKRLREKHRSINVAMADRQIENGWLSAGEQIIEKTEKENDEAEIVLQQAAAMRIQIEDALNKAEQALKNSSLEGAIDIVMQGQLSNCKNDRAVEFVSRIKALAAGKIKENFEKGQIDIAQGLWQKISPMVDFSSDISELGTMLGKTRLASEYIATGRLHESIPLLRQIQALCPSAKWLENILNQTKQAAELLDELKSSPVGSTFTEFSSDEVDFNHLKREIAPVSQQQPTSPGIANIHRQNSGHDVLKSSQFILQIDGVGSYLVLRDSSVSIGPVSSSARPAIGLMADPNLPVATIERVEDDYFIRSPGMVHVNDASTTEKLLVDGDNIALSARCRMKFGMPNQASATATINLSGARLARADIRQIILMNRDILIGPSQANHIRTESGDETLTLYIHNGLLFCKSSKRVIINDESADLKQGLPLNKQIRAGNLSFVITEVS
jgi:hypothetical protein